MAEQDDIEARRIGQLIAELRKRKALSQERLADRVEVSVSTVSRWERGLHENYSKNVDKLARALEVDPSLLTPVHPSTETQLDRIEARLIRLSDLVEARLVGPAPDAKTPGARALPPLPPSLVPEATEGSTEPKDRRRRESQGSDD